MGPRPFSHGNSCRSAIVQVVSTGFNGAATFQSRKPEATATARTPGIEASMGPRPFSHGNSSSASCRAAATPAGFNGAATFQSRKRLRRSPISRLDPSFNGAATFQSRKPRGRYETQSAALQLQWGRDLSVTETSLECIIVDMIRKLQWGRDLSVTETLRRLSTTAQPAHASMGPRPFSHGNAPRIAVENPKVYRFNGAATFQSRKQPRGRDCRQCDPVRRAFDTDLIPR